VVFIVEYVDNSKRQLLINQLMLDVTFLTVEIC